MQRLTSALRLSDTGSSKKCTLPSFARTDPCSVEAQPSHNTFRITTNFGSGCYTERLRGARHPMADCLYRRSSAMPSTIARSRAGATITSSNLDSLIDGIDGRAALYQRRQSRP